MSSSDFWGLVIIILSFISWLIGAGIGLVFYFYIAPRRKWKYPRSVSYAIASFLTFFLGACVLLLILFVEFKAKINTRTIIGPTIMLIFAVMSAGIVYGMSRWSEKERHY